MERTLLGYEEYIEASLSHRELVAGELVLIMEHLTEAGLEVPS